LLSAIALFIDTSEITIVSNHNDSIYLRKNKQINITPIIKTHIC